MRTFSIECSLELPPAALWMLRGTRRFMHHLVSERALARMTASEVIKLREDGPDGPALLQRTFLYVPTTIEIPDIVKTVFSDNYLELADQCTWTEVPASSAATSSASLLSPTASSSEDDDTKSYETNLKEESHNNDMRRETPFSQSFIITPGVLADFISTKGTLSILPDPSGDPARCKHILAGTCNVSLPWVGYYIEEAIVANMQSFYNEYPRHISSMRSILEQEIAVEKGQSSKAFAAEDLIASAYRISAREATEDAVNMETADSDVSTPQSSRDSEDTSKPSDDLLEDEAKELLNA